MNAFRERVAANVRAAIEADGRTQAAVAAEAWPDLAPANGARQIRKILAGERPLREGSALALARALGCDPGDFYVTRPCVQADGA